MTMPILTHCEVTVFLTRSKARDFDSLVKPHLRGLYRFAHRLTGNPSDAEDLVQDVMLKLYPRTRELGKIENLRPWLNRVLYRQSVDRDRKEKRRHEQSLTDTVGDDDHNAFMERFFGEGLGPLAEMEGGRARQLVNEALQELSADQRSLIIMCDVGGWLQDDIAEVLEVAPGTIKSRLSRCRARLREIIQARMEP